MYIESLVNETIISLFNQLKGSTILITGVTGLIGSQVVQLLSYANDKYATRIHIIGHARDKNKVEKCFHNLPCKDMISFIYGNLAKDDLLYAGLVDYIVHAAAPTASKDFIDRPVEVITSIVHGTENVLRFAEVKKLKKIVFLSTMEIYGFSLLDIKRSEKDYDTLDHLAVRSSYPESKKLAEAMCSAWFHEKRVPVSIARLTQTFGCGVPYEDQRVFAEFARCAVEKRDIILHSAGETRRNYLFIGDALSAILTLLVKGTPGEAYNVANDDVYLSIFEMAQIVVKHFGQNQIKVYIETDNNAQKMGYAPPLLMNLSTDKLRALGWQPTSGIIEMYESMIGYWDRNGII